MSIKQSISKDLKPNYGSWAMTIWNNLKIHSQTFAESFEYMLLSLKTVRSIALKNPVLVSKLKF